MYRLYLQGSGFVSRAQTHPGILGLTEEAFLVSLPGHVWTVGKQRTDWQRAPPWQGFLEIASISQWAEQELLF